MASTPHDTSVPAILQLAGRPFAELPQQHLTRSYGVDYAHVPLAPEGGDLYVTCHGWPFLHLLLPENWFAREHYSRHGLRLPGSTGTVYRVATRPVDGRSIEIVVKFSRVGQEVPLEIATTFPEGVAPEEIGNARFNGPFEEFGLVFDMRRGEYGPEGLNLLAQRPLAIYAPAKRFDLWQLGRSEGRFMQHRLRLREDQRGVADPKAIELDIKRDYVVLYNWIKGEDAEAYYHQGLLSEAGLKALTGRTNTELAAKGFRVLDTKPKHFILRRSRRGPGFVKRGGRLAYGLVDFELLERTATYHQQFKKSRRALYWAMQRHDHPLAATTTAGELTPVQIMDVDYFYGTAPNGGKLWVVGDDPALFDYFLPDRWRRTARLKLSTINEVYRTRSRDNIYLVYRRTRLGEKPHVEPMYGYGREILAHGINSPFEEVAIAVALRRAGVPATYPRAIYRTGHRSETAAYIADNRRYETHRHLVLPDDPTQPVLSAAHDYYLISGLWRGVDPMADTQHDGVIDVQQAYDEALLSEAQFNRLVESTRRRMAAVGFADESVQHTQFLLAFSDDGQDFVRQDDGEFALTFAVDAQRAYEHGLLDDTEYRELIERQHDRLLEAGFEALELHGDHLLLTVDPDGVFKRDAAGEPRVTHCNFDLIRPQTHAAGT